MRNDLFNATPAFQTSVPSYKKNDWGYTIGGPVYIPGFYNTKKDKTFFFWSQEWRRDRVPGQNFNLLVPSVAERSGNFSDLCPGRGLSHRSLQPEIPFPAIKVPVDPASAKPLLGMIPLPTVRDESLHRSPIAAHQLARRTGSRGPQYQ